MGQKEFYYSRENICVNVSEPVCTQSGPGPESKVFDDAEIGRTS